MAGVGQGAGWRDFLRSTLQIRDQTRGLDSRE
jgi:hypothetical protein